MRPSSARALLLVMIGEFVWPAGPPAWSSTLLSGLAEFDIEPNAARKACPRHRMGRALAGALGHRAGEPARAPASPAEQAAVGRAGLPATGEWLTPHWERGEQVAQIVRELGLGDQAHSFVGELGPIGDPLRLIDAAWNLDDLDKDYRSFIDAYAQREPRTDREHFRARVELVQDWRRFPYLDPDLPAAYLPPSWPAAEASRLFTERYRHWQEASGRYWDAVVSAS